MPVESLQLEILDTAPARVEAVLQGVLAEPCHVIDLVEEITRPEEHRIELRVEASPAADRDCPGERPPYRLSVPLGVSALPVGEYLVVANGESAGFTIDPVGDFPVLSLPLFQSESRILVPRAGLSLFGPEGWERRNLEWKSPPFWSARIGLRLHRHGSATPESDLLPKVSELHESSESRLGWGTGVRFRVSRPQAELWSEHLFIRTGPETLCEFWMEAPSEPLLEAAGEAFWRMVRFSARVIVEVALGEVN